MDKKGLRNMDKKLNVCAFALALLLLVSLAGCSGASDKEEPAVTPEQTSTAPAPILPESPTPPVESVAENEVIHVSTAGEFLEAIAPGVVIELAPGTYNLTEYLHDASDNVSNYVARSFTDGWQAEIHEVDNLTIRGSKDGKVEVVSEPRYSDVLYFNDCSNISIENITFGYTPSKTILHDVTVHAQPGKTIAIVGPTGAGKTTIINLLMRFYDVNDGAIYVDGEEIRQVTRDSLRGAYTMVLQDTWLFHGTIFDNIAYGREGATEEEVIAAAKAARIHSYIQSLPDGYQTELSDEGINISKGQRQLITIARAMLSDSSMLILDEATSNVDSRTEIQIQQAMNKLMEGRTCFIIAHRLSTIKNADTILVLQNGTVTEQGTHDELIAKGGFYATLYNSQFS